MFKSMMVKKNLDLELQALSIIQQRNGVLPKVFESGKGWTAHGIRRTDQGLQLNRQGIDKTGLGNDNKKCLILHFPANSGQNHEKQSCFM